MAPPFPQGALCPGPSQPCSGQGSCCHGGWGAPGAESPPQVVPGHDWHILRSQKVLCAAPAVIRCCWSPKPPHA